MRLSHVQGDIAVVGHVGNTCRARSFLRGYQNHTVGTTRTVDSCRTGILQYGDRLYILGSNVTQITTGNTVDHDQRTVRGRQRTGTTHLNISHGIGVSFCGSRHVKTCHLTGNQSHRITRCTLVELVFVHLYDRA